MRKTFLLLLALLSAPALFAATSFPISGGSLVNDLSANGFKLQNVGKLNIGNGAGADSGRINLTGATTTAASGIWFGSDVNLFRSGATALTITGNVTITGTITGSNLSTASTDNVWTGSNTFSGPLVFSTVTPTFTTASGWRAALGVGIGTDVQAYDADLSALGALDKSNGNVIIGTGSAWSVLSGSSLRTAIRLGSGDTVTFTGVTAPTLTLGTAATITSPGSGNLLLTGATGITGILTVPAGAVLGAASAPVVVQDQLLFGPDSGRRDVNLYRSAANVLKTDDAFVAASASFTTPLGTASGGTGTTPATVGSNKLLYSDGSAWVASTLTDYGRTLLAQTSASDTRTTLGLGTSATLNAPATGDATSAQTVLGNDSRLLTVTGVSAATYGSTSTIPVLAVDAFGRITSASSVGLAAGSVTLGTTTAGNYVANLTGGTGVTITGTPAGPWTPVISIGQSVATSASPTFASLTLTGNETIAGNSAITGNLAVSGAFTTATGAFTSLSTSSLTGLIRSTFLYVKPGAAEATDSRTGLSAYDMFRPFNTAYAAITAAATGDTVVLQKGAYSSLSVPIGVNVLLEAGATAQVQVSTGAGASTTIFGWGSLGAATGDALAVQAPSSVVSCTVPVAGVISVTGGTLELSKPVVANLASATVATIAAGTTLTLYPGTALINVATSGTYAALAAASGSTVNLYGAVPLGGTGISGSPTVNSTYGLIVARRMLFTTASFTGATSLSNGVLIGSATKLYENGGNLTVNTGIAASSLSLSTALPITSGGTGATSASAARAALGIVQPLTAIETFFYSSNAIAAATGIVYCANSGTTDVEATLPDASTSGLATGSTVLVVQTGALTTGGTTTIAPFSGQSLVNGGSSVVLTTAGQAVSFRKVTSSSWAVDASYTPSASGFTAPVTETFSGTNTVGTNTDLVFLTNSSSAVPVYTLPTVGTRDDHRPITIVQMGDPTTGYSTINPNVSDSFAAGSDAGYPSSIVWLTHKGQSVTLLPSHTDSNWTITSNHAAASLQDTVVVESFLRLPSSSTTYTVNAARTPVTYVDTNLASNFSINVVGNTSPSLDFAKLLPRYSNNYGNNIGQSLTVVLVVRSGTTPYVLTSFKIDNVTITPGSDLLWQNGTAPSGVASATTVYSFSIFHTASASYKVLGSWQVYQ